jgi:hypothetical protein
MPERIVLLNRFLTGWSGYFALADTPWVFRDLMAGCAVVSGR